MGPDEAAVADHHQIVEETLLYHLPTMEAQCRKFQLKEMYGAQHHHSLPES